MPLDGEQGVKKQRCNQTNTTSHELRLVQLHPGADPATLTTNEIRALLDAVLQQGATACAEESARDQALMAEYLRRIDEHFRQYSQDTRSSQANNSQVNNSQANNSSHSLQEAAVMQPHD